MKSNKKPFLCKSVYILIFCISIFLTNGPSLGQDTTPPQAGYYYQKTVEQIGGVGKQQEFDGPYYKTFPWPAPATRPLHFALFVPQLVDTWKPLVYAVEQTAKKLNVQLSIYSADGYVNLGRQIKQLRQSGPKYDGVLVSAIDSYKMDDVLSELGEKIPVLGFVNEVYSKGIHAKAMAFYTDLGATMGRFLIDHIKSKNLKREMKIAFVMGPKGAAWSEDMENGVIDTLKADKSIAGRFKITAQRNGHTKKDMQERLVRIVLEQDENIDLLVGSAPAIERASSMRNEYSKRHPNLQLAAIYFNADLYPAFMEGKVLAAGSEQLLDTGRLAVSMLLKLVNGQKVGTKGNGLPYRVSPTMKIYTAKDIENFPAEALLGPTDYEPTLVK